MMITFCCCCILFLPLENNKKNQGFSEAREVQSSRKQGPGRGSMLQSIGERLYILGMMGSGTHTHGSRRPSDRTRATVLVPYCLSSWGSRKGRAFKLPPSNEVIGDGLVGFNGRLWFTYDIDLVVSLHLMRNCPPCHMWRNCPACFWWCLCH